jgi:hypothetical protein
MYLSKQKGSFKEYRKLNCIDFRLMHKGGVSIKSRFYLIFVALLLVGCSADSRDAIIYEKLGVDKDAEIPKSTQVTIEEMDKKTMRYTEVKLGDVGENAARLLVAADFSGLNDHFSSGLMDVIDAEGTKYRAIYIGHYYKENFSAENEYEKAVLEFYRTKDKGDEKPYIQFKIMD